MNASPSPSCSACTHQSCHRKECRRRVPKSAICRPGCGAQTLDLLPDLGHRAGIEHLQLEPPHVAQHGAGAQFHQDRQRRDLPQHDLGPRPFEGQLILPVALFQVIGRQAQLLEPVHEVGREHLPLAIEGVAAHPGRLRRGVSDRDADIVELLAQLALVHQVGQPDGFRAVDQRERHLHVRAGCGRPTGTSAACRSRCRSGTGRSGRSSICGSRRGWRCRPWGPPGISRG